MESQIKTSAPPLPPDISATLRLLKPGNPHLFRPKHIRSVQAMCTRISRELGCSFKTKTCAEGIWVWRKPEDPEQSGNG
jgi:hypothetical protein